MHECPLRPRVLSYGYCRQRQVAQLWRRCLKARHVRVLLTGQRGHCRYIRTDCLSGAEEEAIPE